MMVNPSLAQQLARALTAERSRAAERFRKARRFQTAPAVSTSSSLPPAPAGAFTSEQMTPLHRMCDARAVAHSRTRAGARKRPLALAPGTRQACGAASLTSNGRLTGQRMMICVHHDRREESRASRAAARPAYVGLRAADVAVPARRARRIHAPEPSTPDAAW